MTDTPPAAIVVAIEMAGERSPIVWRRFWRTSPACVSRRPASRPT